MTSLQRSAHATKCRGIRHSSWGLALPNSAQPAVAQKVRSSLTTSGLYLLSMRVQQQEWEKGHLISYRC